MRRNIMTVCLVVLAVYAFNSETFGRETQKMNTLVLAQDGQPVATIVLAQEPTRAAALAAVELQEHIRKITGAQVPIVTADRTPAGVRILVGESAATRKLGLQSADFKSQEYLIRTYPDTLVLMGRDKPDPLLTADITAVSGKPQWVAGKFGQALAFNGTNDALALKDSGFTDDTGTLEAWVRFTAATNDGGTILRLDGEPWTYHIVHRQGNSIQYVVYLGKEVASVTSPALAEGWHHVLATHDAKAGKIELFIDGRSQGTAKYVQTTCRNRTLCIGGGTGGAGDKVGNPFNGLIDEVRVSSAVIAPASDWAVTPCAADDRTVALLRFDTGKGLPQCERMLTQVLQEPPLPDSFDEQGTCYAVYDFLERCCDVRWYLPTDLGLVCPSNRTLKVSGVDVRRAPAMKYRYARPECQIPQDLCGDTIRGPTPTPVLDSREQALWWRRQRIGGEPYDANHSLYGYYRRFGTNTTDPFFVTNRPDFFAQGYQGPPQQMCYTSTGLICQLVQDARDYFDGRQTGKSLGIFFNPTAPDYFPVVPMDNGAWCKCPDCAGKVLPTSVRAKGFFSNDIASDYLFHFVNQIARQVRQTHPDKFIATLAYADYAYPPSREQLAPNISIQLCLHARQGYSKPVQDNDLKILNLWVNESKDRRKFLWLYYCFPSLNATTGQWRCFPGFFGHHVVKQMATWHQAGIRGMSYEPSYLPDSQRSVLFDQVETYVTWKLADDPTLDGNQLIEEFFTRYYGAAAQPMKAFYNQVEEIYGNPTNYPDPAAPQVHQTEEIAWGKLGTAERMQTLGGLMEQASAVARTAIEKQRVALFDKGVWQYMVKGRELYLKNNAKKAIPLPQVRAPRVAGGVSDGNPAKIDWSKALVLDHFTGLYGEQTERKVEIRATHDGNFLYLQLVEFLDPKKLVSSGTVWSDDEWELFFARQRGPAYRQMGVNSQGIHIELAYGESKKEWDSGAVVVSDITASDRWTVQISLPLAKLLPDGTKPGDKIYLNIIRSTAMNTALALSWVPTFGGYHAPSRLGELILMER